MRRRWGLPPALAYLAWLIAFVVTIAVGGVAGFVTGVVIVGAWCGIDAMFTQSRP